MIMSGFNNADAVGSLVFRLRPIRSWAGDALNSGIGVLR